MEYGQEEISNEKIIKGNNDIFDPEADVANLGVKKVADKNLFYKYNDNKENSMV